MGLNSSRLLLEEEVRLVVGFCGERNGRFWGGGSLEGHGLGLSCVRGYG